MFSDNGLTKCPRAQIVTSLIQLSEPIIVLSPVSSCPVYLWYVPKGIWAFHNFPVFCCPKFKITTYYIHQVDEVKHEMSLCGFQLNVVPASQMGNLGLYSSLCRLTSIHILWSRPSSPRLFSSMHMLSLSLAPSVRVYLLLLSVWQGHLVCLCPPFRVLWWRGGDVAQRPP